MSCPRAGAGAAAIAMVSAFVIAGAGVVVAAGAGAAAPTASMIEPHSAHSGQRPTHFAGRCPHESHWYTARGSRALRQPVPA